MSLNATKVAVTRRLPANIEERMGELFDTRLNQTDAALSRDELGALIAAWVPRLPATGPDHGSTVPKPKRPFGSIRCRAVCQHILYYM